ncbi:MAG: hypothetical protein ABJE66_08300 [Deltaproteobacteria bacterium]
MHLREPFPLRTYLGLSLLGLGCGFVGALTGATLASNVQRVATSIPIVDLPASVEVTPIASATAAHDERQPAPSNKPGFVIEVDGAKWMVLDVDATTLVTHRAPHLAHGEYASDTIAMLRDRDLTGELRAWRRQQVIVATSEGASCTDTLHDFALISQVTGDPVYAAAATQHWTAASIEEHGTHLVAAKLAHCTGMYARAASAPAAVPFAEIPESDELAKQATSVLLASEAGRTARTSIEAQYSATSGSSLDFTAATEISTKVTRDPRTGTAWVMVHAHSDFACGGLDINFFGLYRVADGALVSVREQASPELAGVDALVDLDGDGVPELLGNGWLDPNRAFYNQDLEPIVTYSIPFFGCPC